MMKIWNEISSNKVIFLKNLPVASTSGASTRAIGSTTSASLSHSTMFLHISNSGLISSLFISSPNVAPNEDGTWMPHWKYRYFLLNKLHSFPKVSGICKASFSIFAPFLKLVTFTKSWSSLFLFSFWVKFGRYTDKLLFPSPIFQHHFPRVQQFEISRFLCVCSWTRSFVHFYATIVQPSALW